MRLLQLTLLFCLDAEHQLFPVFLYFWFVDADAMPLLYFSAQLQGLWSTEVYVQRSIVVRDVRSQNTSPVTKRSNDRLVLARVYQDNHYVGVGGNSFCCV